MGNKWRLRARAVCASKEKEEEEEAHKGAIERAEKKEKVRPELPIWDLHSPQFDPTSSTLGYSIDLKTIFNLWQGFDRERKWKGETIEEKLQYSARFHCSRRRQPDGTGVHYECALLPFLSPVPACIVATNEGGKGAAWKRFIISRCENTYYDDYVQFAFVRGRGIENGGGILNCKGEGKKNRHVILSFKQP